jgi:hypothetical protein
MAEEREQLAAKRALKDMRSARRSRFVEQLDVMELLYRVYLALIFGAFALAVVAGAVNDAGVNAHAADGLANDGPAWLGAGIALAVLVGLRSGARGGPLAIEAAEVQHVLLAPIDRGTVLRTPALRQLRVALLAGAVFGAVAGNFAFRRLPGSPLEWLLCLALFGVSLPLCTLAAALLASGRRLRPAIATAAGAVLLAWSLADVLLGSTTSPATMLGVLATLPLQSGGHVALAAAGAAFAVALACAGLLSLGGLSLEAARRRASLTAQLRFSASVRDVRTVILLRRQLASENPRRRPWARPRERGRFPVWRRGWHSFLRWPLVRVVRALAAGVVAGALAAGAWSGTTPLAAVAALVLLVAALDLVEPLAQEADHPTRRDLLPVRQDSLVHRHLVAPAAAMAIVILAGVAVAAALGAPGTAIGVGLVMLVPTAIVLLCCAALSATNDPYANLFVPEIGYAESALPILAAIGAVAAPLLVAREVARQGGSAAIAAASVEVVVLIVAAAMAWWLGQRVLERTAVRP